MQLKQVIAKQGIASVLFQCSAGGVEGLGGIRWDGEEGLDKGCDHMGQLGIQTRCRKEEGKDVKKLVSICLFILETESCLYN